MNRLSYINELRGVAIILVLVVHTARSIPGMNHYLLNLVNFGQMGVQLFFMLSAFTLCLSNDKREKAPVLYFYLRRFFRIAPLYYFGLVLYLIISLYSASITASSDYTPSNILSNLFFIHSFNPKATNNVVPGGWSVGTEVAFYAIFPLVYYLYEKIELKTWVLILTPLVVFCISFIAAVILEHRFGELISNNRFYYFNIINQFSVFLSGMSMFYLYKNKLINIGYWTALIFAVPLLLLSIYLLNFHFNVVAVPFISGISFFFVFQMFRLKRKTLPFLGNIGVLSFSIYILHYPFALILSRYIYNGLKSSFGSELIYFTCLIVTLTLSYLTSKLSYQYIEKKGLNVGYKLIHYLEQRSK